MSSSFPYKSVGKRLEINAEICAMKGQRRDEGLAKQIADKLRKLRLGCGYSQEEVYFKTGVNVYRVESGRHIVSLPTLNVLLKHYNNSLGEFFDDSMG